VGIQVAAYLVEGHGMAAVVAVADAIGTFEGGEGHRGLQNTGSQALASGCGMPPAASGNLRIPVAAPGHRLLSPPALFLWGCPHIPGQSLVGGSPGFLIKT
jgi:hypothetical protein